MANVHSIADKVEIPFLMHLKKLIYFLEVVHASYSTRLLMTYLSLSAAVFSKQMCVSLREEVLVVTN